MSDLTLPGPVAKRCLSLAVASVGTQEEGGNNRGFMIERYQNAAEIGREPWCAVFLFWCLCKAYLNHHGNPDVDYEDIDALEVAGRSLGPGFPTFTAWTPDLKQWAVENNVWIPRSEFFTSAGQVIEGVLQPGDWILFYFPNLDGGRIGHVEVLKKTQRMSLLTVGGNTSQEAGLSRESSNGRDGVWRKDRSRGEIGRLGGAIRIGA
jgi:hypothetical protein